MPSELSSGKNFLPGWQTAFLELCLPLVEKESKLSNDLLIRTLITTRGPHLHNLIFLITPQNTTSKYHHTGALRVRPQHMNLVGDKHLFIPYLPPEHTQTQSYKLNIYVICKSSATRKAQS